MENIETIKISDKTPNDILLEKRNRYIREFDAQYRAAHPEYTPFQRGNKISGDLEILYEKGLLSKKWKTSMIVKVMTKLGIYN